MNHKNGKPLRSLSQILSLSITAILAVLLLGNLISNTTITKAHLEERVYVHARDAANSLGLSLSTIGDDEDYVLSSRMIDSIYDSGDFASITLVSSSGKLLHRIKRDQDEELVPDWFVQILSFHIPDVSANVMSGWTQKGTVHVKSRLDKAYLELWHAWVSQVIWFLVVLVIAIILVRLLLGRILRPLIDVEKQASEMSRKNFAYRVDAPDSRELAGVVEAMNFMAESLGNVFDRQLDQIEDLRSKTRMDSLTGLFNRDGFDQRMTAELQSEHGYTQGALFILNVHQLDEMNRNSGREEVDGLLTALGQEIVTFIKDYPDGFAARRAGGDFALFLPSVVLEASDEVAEALFNKLMAVRPVRQMLKDNILHMGVASVFEGDELGAVLAKADMALREAQAKLVSAWQRYGDIEELSVEAGVREANQWHSLLESAVVEDGFALFSQPVRSSSDQQEFIYLQMLARLSIDNTEYSAGSFIPMAKRFGMMPQVDRQIVEKALAVMIGEDDDFGVSLSAESIEDAEFMFWFYGMVQSLGAASNRLRVQFPEYVLVNHGNQAKDLCTKLKSLGVKSVIERFGVSSVPFSYLQWLELDAIKIDHSFVRGIDQNLENQFFLRSAIQMAHSRQVKVIAVGIENESEKAWLESVGIDGMMGYFFDRPVQVGS